MRMRGMKAMAAVLVGFALSGAGSAAAAGLDAPAVAQQKYATYKARVEGGDLTVDWRAFRLAAMVGGVGGDYDWHTVRNQVLQHLNDGKDETALKGAREIIAHNMANPEGHLLAMMVLRKDGKDADAAQQRAIVNAIVKSILDSGDGKSAKTAWFTVDPSEEYFLINVVLGAQPKGQALVQQDGHAFDKMTVVDDQGTEHTLWFNTDTDMQILAAALGEGAKPAEKK